MRLGIEFRDCRAIVAKWGRIVKWPISYQRMQLICILQRVLGVLDIDCEETEGFDERDRVGLEAVAAVLVESCEWP